MIAVDTNILVYAHREEMSVHNAALHTMTELAQGPDAWALPVFVIVEFLRVVTNGKVFDPPTTPADATGTIAALLASPAVRVLHPGPRFWPLLEECIAEGRARGHQMADAAIAALCREHGVRTVLSEDRDFRRFPSITLKTLADA